MQMNNKKKKQFLYLFRGHSGQNLCIFYKFVSSPPSSADFGENLQIIFI